MHMSFQVYFHRVTRGWEAHLLCLFNWATELANSGSLPAETPNIVLQFFSQKGILTSDQFLQFDEAVMLAALHAWATSPKSDAYLAVLAKSFLFREKQFEALEYQNDPVKNSFRAVAKLMGDGARDKIHFYHDDASFRGYKDFGRSVAALDAEEAAASEAIFLADGDPTKPAIPMEHEDNALITRTLSQTRQVPLNRVFVHRPIYDRLFR
jgi:hypothetical protein